MGRNMVCEMCGDFFLVGERVVDILWYGVVRVFVCGEGDLDVLCLGCLFGLKKGKK